MPFACAWNACAQWCLTLCDPVDHSPPGSSVHGILQARTLEWIGMLSSRGSSQPRDRTCISGGFFITSATWEACPPNLTAKTPAPHMVSKAPASSPGSPPLIWALTIPIFRASLTPGFACAVPSAQHTLPTAHHCSLFPTHPPGPQPILWEPPWSPRPDRCALLSPPPTWHRPPCRVKPPHPVRPPG